MSKIAAIALLLSLSAVARGQSELMLVGQGAPGAASAITIDAQSNSAAGTGACVASPCTWTHVTGAGCAHCVLTVTLAAELSNLATATCTYNSVSMTRVAVYNTASTYYDAIFILVAPASGSHTVSCAIGTGVANGARGHGYTFSGVNQTGTSGTTYRAWAASPPNEGNTEGGTQSTAISVVSNNAVSGDMVVDASTSAGSTYTIGGGQTAGFTDTNIAFNNYAAASSYKLATGSATMTWTLAASNYWVDAAIALIPG